MKNLRQRNLYQTEAHLSQVNRKKLYLKKLKSRKSPIRIPTEVKKKNGGLLLYTNTSYKRSQVAFRGKILMKIHALQFFRFFHQKNSVLKNISKIVAQVCPSIERYHLLYKSTYCTKMKTASRSLNGFVGRCLRFEVKKLNMNMILRRLTYARNKLEIGSTQTTVLI